MLNRFTKRTVCGMALLLLFPATVSREAVAAPQSLIQAETDSPHAHLLLITASGGIVPRDEVKKYMAELKEESFIDSSGESSENPLAPCALVGAGTIAVYLNAYWAKIISGSPVVPTPGSNILGMFDRDLNRGRVPRDEPRKTAEIIARLFIWYSWANDAPANTIIEELTQRECQHILLSGPEEVLARISRLKPSDVVFTHSPAMLRYSALLPAKESKRFLEKIGQMGFLELSTGATDNPLAPCSLLMAMRSASRINQLWRQVSTGGLAESNDPLLKSVSAELKSGKVPRDDDRRAMEITALLFAATISAAHDASHALLSDVTQLECLNEIFEPGLIRKRRQAK
jgi:hypothetical protein